MAVGNYTAARSRTIPEPGIPGLRRPPIYQLRFLKGFGTLGTLEVQAVTWDDFGVQLEGFNAWPQAFQVPADQIEVSYLGEIIEVQAEAHLDLIFIETNIALAGQIQIRIPAAARKLTTSDGWITSGLLWNGVLE